MSCLSCPCSLPGLTGEGPGTKKGVYLEWSYALAEAVTSAPRHEICLSDMSSALEAAQKRRLQGGRASQASAESKQWRPKAAIAGELGKGAVSALEKAKQRRECLQNEKQSDRLLDGLNKQHLQCEGSRFLLLIFCLLPVQYSLNRHSLETNPFHDNQLTKGGKSAEVNNNVYVKYFRQQEQQMRKKQHMSQHAREHLSTNLLNQVRHIKQGKMMTGLQTPENQSQNSVQVVKGVKEHLIRMPGGESPTEKIDVLQQKLLKVNYDSADCRTTHTVLISKAVEVTKKVESRLARMEAGLLIEKNNTGLLKRAKMVREKLQRCYFLMQLLPLSRNQNDYVAFVRNYKEQIRGNENWIEQRQTARQLVKEVSALEAAQKRRLQGGRASQASAESKQWRPKAAIAGELGKGAVSALEKAKQRRECLQNEKQSETLKAPASEPRATGRPRH